MTENDERRQKTKELAQHYRKDLESFARNCLIIKGQGPNDPILPLVFNRGQRYIHERLEKQRRETGKVRAIIVKGRRLGSSTYIAARYYHRASLNRGINVFILSHSQSSADTLFDMVDRFQRNNPIRPHVGTSNIKVLEFDRRESRYEVATANENGDTGRSNMTTLYHGSEVPMWKNVDGHFAASVKTVAPLPGTEIIFESTAKGPSGKFYDLWQKAESGQSEYQAIFVPWYWSDEYRETPPAGFELDKTPDEVGMTEVEYAELFGLDMEQMAWRRNEINLLGERKFRQEFPATAAEAFQASDTDSFIKALPVLRARKRNETEGAGPLIIGGDPAGAGGDRFAVAYRRGYVVEKVEYRNKIEPVEAVEWLKSLIDKHDPARFNIDAGGIGAAIISHLRAKGPKYAKVVKAINFGAKSQFKYATPKVPGPVNRRAEMWDRSREWLDLEEGVSIPDNDELQSDAITPRVKPRPSNDYVLESKEEMRKRGARSPDLWDAVALTFADLSHIKEWSEKKKSVDPRGETPLAPEYVEDPFCTSPHGWMAN